MQVSYKPSAWNYKFRFECLLPTAKFSSELSSSNDLIYYTWTEFWNVFKAHQDKEFINLLHKNKIRTIFVPPSTTEELHVQPCDRSVNGKLKSILKQKFVSWYSEQVSSQLSNGVPVEKISIDLRVSEIKPAHANWLLHAFDVLSKDNECILNGFQLAGISGALGC